MQLEHDVEKDHLAAVRHAIKCLRNWEACNKEEPPIPEYMEGPIMEYLLYGNRVGHFLRSLITQSAWHIVVAEADPDNRQCLRMWNLLLCNLFPGGAWGSRNEYAVWIEQHGTMGNIPEYLLSYEKGPRA